MANRDRTRSVSEEAEYSLALERAERIEANIWQTAVLFGIGSVVGIVAVLREVTESTPASPFTSLAISIVGITTALVWWRFARRWWSIQYLLFERMEYLDATTGMNLSSIVRERDDQAQSDRRHRQLHGPLLSRLASHYFRLNIGTIPAESASVRQHEYRGMREASRLLVYTLIGIWSLIALQSLQASQNNLGLVLVSAAYLGLVLVLWRRL